MDWFERLTGFREDNGSAVREQLEIRGSKLHSIVNGASYIVGELELVALAELRRRVALQAPAAGKLRFQNMVGDVRKFHGTPQHAGALFQVASQFNLLEMVGPDVSPEDGVTGYAYDKTQGPACAIAVGAATIYRNYLVPVGDQVGQTADRQIDGLSDIGSALARALGERVESLWSMRNGYALCTEKGLRSIATLLGGLDDAERDNLRGLLRIGVLRDAEVTDFEPPRTNRVAGLLLSLTRRL